MQISFSIVHTTVLQDPGLVESANAESGDIEDQCILEKGKVFPFSKSIIKWDLTVDISSLQY